MLYVYTGTPGSGKSYHVASDIYRYLKRGKNVISNFDVCDSILKNKKSRDSNFIYAENCDITVDALVGFALNFHKVDSFGRIKERQTLLVMDECQNIFNSRSWSDKERPKWCNFFQQHRKYGYTVVFVTQYKEMIDKQIRESCFQREINHRCLNVMGIGGFLLGLLFFGKIFICIETDLQTKQRNGTTFVRGKKRIYNFYNSYKIFESKFLN